MEPQVNLRVSCRGETQSFLVSDSAHTTWADVEAMVSPGPGSFWSGSWGLKEVGGAGCAAVLPPQGVLEPFGLVVCLGGGEKGCSGESC